MLRSGAKAGDTIYVMIAFLGAACYAAEHLYIEMRIPPSVSVDVLLFIMFASAAAILLPVTLATGTFLSPAWPPETQEWAILGVAGVTLLDYFFITLLIVWAGPVFTSQAVYIVKLSGVMWGIAILGDALSLWVWGAIALILTGLALVHPRKQAT